MDKAKAEEIRQKARGCVALIFPKWKTCDGSIADDEMLRDWLQSALDREDFERAAEIRDELKRRAALVSS